MGSRYAALLKEQTLGSANTNRIADLDETDPYYFVAYEGDKLLAEGELSLLKMRLDDRYLYKPIKSFTRSKINMVATIKF